MIAAVLAPRKTVCFDIMKPYTYIGGWGGVSNREIDFGFGCGAVRACVKLCAINNDLASTN